MFPRASPATFNFHDLLAMSAAPRAILRPFLVNPAACRHFARFGLRASHVEAAENEKNELERSQGKTWRKKKPMQESGLEVLYDDGFGSATVKDYLEAVRAMPTNDGGPPRWFCPVECGQPEVHNAPLMLFLPGIDGVGLELTLQHKSLGKVFEVRCLHIPANDRTPFEGLLQNVEDYVKYEQDLSANRPIYIIGDSFGGFLAISVAARNPEIDFVLILVNTATTFLKSPLQTILPLLEAMPTNLRVRHPHLLRYLIGNRLKMAMVSSQNNVSPRTTLQKFSESLIPVPPLDSELGDIIRIDTLVWKLKLLNSGAAYANSQLHAVQAEVLLLVSGMNLAQREEADRLFKTLKNCKLRYFRDSRDRLLMGDGFNMLTVLKGASMYRRGREQDLVANFLPPTLSEFKRTFGEDFKLVHHLLSPVMLSTLKNGKIVRGLAGVPEKGPILFVGYHQLLAMEWSSLVEEFLKEKRKVVRALTHSALFVGNFGPLREELSLFDVVPMYGGLTVSPIHMYRLFERNEHVLLFPGGIREALHRKGEEHCLFWPDQPEFVRMAAKFGATIIPFGCVGEDDFLEMRMKEIKTVEKWVTPPNCEAKELELQALLVATLARRLEVIFDYNDQKDIPFLKDWIKSFNDSLPRVRDTIEGEEGNQVWHMPGVLPKLPGRLYYLFGKPIEMKGMDSVLQDKKSKNDVYSHIKSEVENALSYLKMKREGDPYRSIMRRYMHRAAWGASAQVPTFEL